MRPLKITLAIGLFIVGAVLSFTHPGIGICFGLMGAAVTDNVRREMSHGSHRGNVPLAAGINAYGGSLLCTDANGYGTGVPVATSHFMGVVVTQVDNTGGANGDLAAETIMDGSVDLDFAAADLTQGDVGKTAFMSNNNDATKTSGAATPRIGKIIYFISASKAKVQLDVNATGIT